MGDLRRPPLTLRLSNPFLPLGLALGLTLAMAVLMWLGYDATLQARRSLRLLLERRQAEQLALLWAGIAQDMKGAHTTILAPISREQLVLDPPYDLADTFARGLARFPYPESFFVWKKGQTASSDLLYVFHRADRPPSWLTYPSLTGPYPVVVIQSPAAMSGIVAESRRLARHNRSVVVFESAIDGALYQVVARFFYGDSSELVGIIGFSVPLDWVRREYFAELTRQISRIGGEPNEVALAVLDHARQTVTSTQPSLPDIPLQERSFPLVFADRSILNLLPAENAGFEQYVATAGAAQGSAIAAAATATNPGFWVIGIASVVVIAGLVMTLHAARSAAEFSAMKSDFVSSVTHELKTPLSTIVLVAETFAKGRYDTADTMRRYAGLLSRESRGLTRIINNLLAYASLGDARHAYAFDAIDVQELLDDVLQQFYVLLHERCFDVSVDVPTDLPFVRADRVSLTLALENIIDNAIKYSELNRLLAVAVRQSAGIVAIRVTDAGCGMADDELERLGESFFRGRTRLRGSGMGLAITRRIIDAHRGRLVVTSAVGRGTTVEVQLPVSEFT